MFCVFLFIFVLLSFAFSLQFLNPSLIIAIPLSSWALKRIENCLNRYGVVWYGINITLAIDP